MANQSFLVNGFQESEQKNSTREEGAKDQIQDHASITHPDTPEV